MAEQFTSNEQVVGSIPTISSKKKGTMKIVSFLFVFVSAGHIIVCEFARNIT